MLVRKILETTLTAGSTSVSFNDSDIPYSLIRTYCSDDDIYPVSRTIVGNVLTLNYEAQSSDKYIAVEIVKQGLEIVDDLVSTDTDKALSAKQGKELKDLIDDIVIPTVPENITDLDDVNVSDILQNQVLAWDSTSEKFVNVNQSGGGGGVDYSTTEQDTGLKWIDGKPIYQITYIWDSTTLNSFVSHDISALNPDTLVSLDGFVERYVTATSLSLWHPLNYYEGSNYNVTSRYNESAKTIDIKVSYSAGNECRVQKATIRYTKSTDVVN